jgi:hypothetical protein
MISTGKAISPSCHVDIAENKKRGVSNRVAAKGDSGSFQAGDSKIATAAI